MWLTEADRFTQTDAEWVQVDGKEDVQVNAGSGRQVEISDPVG